MSETSEAPALAPLGAQATYPLRAWPTGFSIRSFGEGVALGPEGIAFLWDGYERSEPWRAITEISLVATRGKYGSVVRQATIAFAEGEPARFQNTDRTGAPDPALDPAFRAFVLDLHRRLVDAGEADRVRFLRGFGAWRAKVARLVIALGAAFFLVGPVIIAGVTGDERALFGVLGGALFLWPAWRNVEANQPESYDPAAPPDLDGAAAPKGR